MTIRIKNHGASAQTRYVNFTLPQASFETYGTTIDLSNGATAVRQYTDGRGHVYTARATWSTASSGVTSVTASAGTPDPDLEFTLHEAFGSSSCGDVVTWSPSCLPWQAMMLDANNVERPICPSLRTSTPTIRINGSRLKQAIWEAHEGGWHVWHVLSVWHDQALARFQTIFMWSDEQYTEAWSMPCRGVRMRYAHEVSAIFGSNENIVASENNRTLTIPFSFLNGTWNDAFANWDNRIYHGRAFCIEGWMFGRTGSTVPGDETMFAAAAELDAVADHTEWEGSFLFAGVVGDEPTYPTSIVEPNWSQTTRGYVTWDRGHGGSDSLGSGGKQGLASRRNSRDTGFTGAFGMSTGHQVVRGYQELRDFRAALRRYGMYAIYMYRDGSMPLAGSTPRFELNQGYPHVNSGNPITQYNFGRQLGLNVTNTDWLLPPKGGVVDNHSNEYLMFSLPPAYHELAKDDYFAYLIVLWFARTRTLDQRRGGVYTGGSGMSGHREWGRTINACALTRAVCPDARGYIDDTLFHPAGSYGAMAKINLSFQDTPANLRLGPVYNTGFLAAGATTVSPGFANQFGTDAIFEGFAAVGIFQLYKLAEDPAEKALYLDIFEKVATTQILYQSVYIPAGTYNSGATEYSASGWYLIYDVLVGTRYITVGNRQVLIPSGEVIPESARIVTSPGGSLNRPYWLQSGQALACWPIGFLWLYSEVGANPLARARARDMYLTITGPGGQPPSWLFSAWKAACDLTLD